MKQQDYEAALAEIAEEDRKTQDAFDEESNAYITRAEQETPYREQDALSLDTNTAEFPTLATDDGFDFAEPDWNDQLEDKQMSHYCDHISDTLHRRGVETQQPRDVLNDLQRLLNCSFSERIKMHIVKLVAGTETIEGACRHCFGLYHEDSNIQGLGNSMYVWQTLCNLIGTVPVFYAFLERAWHLNPTSPYFPDRYRDLVDAVRASELDKSQRQSVHYADPYNQMELLNDTLKKLAYTYRHTSDPTQLAKLANSQVRVAGAMHVINEKLDRKHENAIQDAKARALPS